MRDLKTVFKNIPQKWKYYREEKQDLERFLIFSIKMSAKSNKIELSEEFRAMSCQPLGCHVPFVSRQK